MRTLHCAHCGDGFPAKLSGNQARFCGAPCRDKYHNARRNTKAYTNSTRPCIEPRPGDLVESSGQYRFIIRVGFAQYDSSFVGGITAGECVVYRILPHNEEHFLTIEGWRSWCKKRNGASGSVITHVLSRKPCKGVNHVEQAAQRPVVEGVSSVL